MARMAKLSAIYLAALVALTFTAIPARAETPLHRPVEVNFDGVSVESALATLGERAGVRFEYDADLVKGLHPVTYQAEDQEAGRVAMRILYPRGLELGEMRGDRVRIVKRDPYDEFKPKREEVYEFVRKPTLTREGDDVTIAFETAGWCDVTIAIEDNRGTIIRHLASGVLGPNAPEPFVWNSKAQTVIWDGKNDQGEYVDDKDVVAVRVSLGLKPRFERTLFWHPGKHSSQRNPSGFSGQQISFAPAEEGVFVFDSGQGVDHVRLFDRDGDYVRTIYPFPADKIEEVEGLIYHRFPDGVELPIKPNWLQTTFLMSGSNCLHPTYRDGQYRGIQTKGVAFGGITGAAGDAFAVAGDRIALIGYRLSRFATDGTSGGMNLHGPSVTLRSEEPLWRPRRGYRSEDDLSELRPRRAAISPDGRWLYLARYNETFPGHAGAVLWKHVVKRMSYDGDDEPERFLGAPDTGDADGQFNLPADVACDPEGRVYVADHLNDQIQVFDADGQHLRNISVRRPAEIDIHHKTGEIFVFSWGMSCSFGSTRENLSVEHGTFSPTRFFQLSRFSPLDDGAEEQDSWDLARPTKMFGTAANLVYSATVDTWSDPLRVWIVAPWRVQRERFADGFGVMLLELEDGEWQVKREFLDDASRAISRIRPAPYNRQRLYVDHSTGILYLGEGDSYEGKAFKQLVRIDPRTGRTRLVDLPMSTEDMAFDLDGHAYLRTSGMLVRYDPATWREVPFDYGEEHEQTGYGTGSATRSTQVLSGAIFPGNRGWHHGGMHVSANGNIVVSALYSVEQRARHDERVHSGEAYQPRMYPGRFYNFGGRFGGTLVHVIDRHGQMVHDDAIPGLPATINGTAIDARGDIYLLHAAPAVIDGELHFNDHAGTLMKFTPGESRLLSPRGAPVPLAEKPDRPHDVRGYSTSAWAEGAHWLYTGLGWGGKNPGTGCACPNARFAFDYLARSFTPEIDRYNVGVLDSNGNLILRVGQYGNVDDGEPLVERGGPPNPRSIGGDETALKFAPYVATHTDHRLFIADPGNARIVSVKLGYHTDELVSLKDIPDAGDPAN